MAAWLCASCEGENPEGTRFCGHCGAAAAASDSPIAQTLPSFVAEPVAERLVEAGGEFPEERRLITALFADVSGFTALADRLDPEELLEVIDPVIRGLSNIVGRFDGYVEKFAGDALLALFGAPVSHEDDAARALLVALEMHRELARLCKNLPHQAELTLHCGVSSGHGIARVLGSEARMDYAVLGDSVILAQRLEAAAPKGETYVGDSTYRLTADRFEFEPVGELTLKGKSEAALAWRLVGEKRAEEAARTRPLVGRARELDAVAGVFDRALEGRGGVVVVTGEPGVGKSRLTEGARQHARHMGFRWLQTRCLSYGASLAYWPYAELVRRMAGIQPDTASEEAVALLRATVGLGGSIPFFVRLLGLPAAGEGDVEALEPEAFRRGLHDAFATLLSSLAAESPLVVAVEDLHWADASTLELTRELTGLCEERPLVLYVTARPESQSALEELPSQMVVQLDPLDEAGIAELVANMLDGAAPAGLVPWVVERTTGNPFFVEELVRSLLDRGILQRSNGNWLLQAGWEEGDLPPTVEGLLASRIDLLPRPSVEVLQAAAVIGRVVPIALLDGVLGREATRELAILVDRALLDHVIDEQDQPSPSTTHLCWTSRTRDYCDGSSAACIAGSQRLRRRCTGRETTSWICSRATSTWERRVRRRSNTSPARVSARRGCTPTRRRSSTSAGRWSSQSASRSRRSVESRSCLRSPTSTIWSATTTAPSGCTRKHVTRALISVPGAASLPRIASKASTSARSPLSTRASQP